MMELLDSTYKEFYYSFIIKYLNIFIVRHLKTIMAKYKHLIIK